jgi:hypothetical protein
LSQTHRAGEQEERRAAVGGDLLDPLHALGKVQAGGCWGSAESLIVAPRRSWRTIFGGERACAEESIIRTYASAQFAAMSMQANWPCRSPSAKAKREVTSGASLVHIILTLDPPYAMGRSITPF